MPSGIGEVLVGAQQTNSADLNWSVEVKGTDRDDLHRG